MAYQQINIEWIADAVFLSRENPEIHYEVNILKPRDTIKIYLKNTMCHCLDGPAYISDNIPEWFIHNIRWDKANV